VIQEIYQELCRDLDDSTLLEDAPEKVTFVLVLAVHVIML